MTKSGIYKIECQKTQKFYIGSSSNLPLREYDHFRFLNSGRHINPKLQAAFSKHGNDAFTFEILLYCSPEDCICYEQLLIDGLYPAFNINKKAGKPPSQKGKKYKRTPEHIKKYKIAAKKREAAKLEEKMNTELWMYKEIQSSGLSVRKFCKLHGLTKNRTAINKRYRQYLNGVEETTKIT